MFPDVSEAFAAIIRAMSAVMMEAASMYLHE
jgi:hypothetical protein